MVALTTALAIFKHPDQQHPAIQHPATPEKGQDGQDNQKCYKHREFIAHFTAETIVGWAFRRSREDEALETFSN